MRMCEKHWAMLREAVVVRGMWHLVAKDDEEAMARTVTEMRAVEQGGRGTASYEPLLSMMWMIYGRAMRHMGYLLHGPDVERGLPDCPICEAVRRHPANCPHCGDQDHERLWIDGPADAALAEAKRLGLEIRPVA
jgi:hypothetical protein